MKRTRVIALAVLFIALGMFGGLAISVVVSHASATPSDSPGYEAWLSELDSRIDALPPQQQNFVLVSKKITPAVVTVASEKTITGQQMMPDLPEEFRRFFPEERFRTPERQQRGLGSGVVISSDGLIITNNHVVDGATEISVTLSDDRTLSAELVGRDPSSDIAVLRVDATGLPYAKWGNSDDLEVGQWVLAVGNPFSENLRHTVTAGIISATSRGSAGISTGGLQDYIQTDAAINPGNSGGALVNMQGDVIGINTAIISRTGQFNGIGLAVPSNLARTIADRLISDGRIVRGYLGVYPARVTDKLARAFGMDRPRGALINMVIEDSPAEKGGLRAGDIVLKIDGVEISDNQDLTNKVGLKLPGTTVDMEVLRDSQIIHLSVTLTGREEDLTAETTKMPDKMENEKMIEHLGLELAPMNQRFAQQYPGRTGVIVKAIKPTSPAAEAGLRPGMLISKINMQEVKSIADFEKVLAGLKAGDFARIYAYIPNSDGTAVGVFFPLEIPE